MPYSKSKSRKYFDLIILDLTKTVKDTGTPQSQIPNIILQSVYKSVIFQSSAALEDYLKSLFEDWLFMIDRNNILTNNIPKELVYWELGRRQVSIFKKYILNGDEKKFVNELSKENSFKILLSDNSHAKDLLTKDFFMDKKYPSIRNIESLFARFGIKNIFDELGKTGRKNYRILLKSFSDKRTEIAHQYPSTDLTGLDTLNSLNFLINFVNCIDRVVHNYVTKTTGNLCWLR